MKTSRVDPSLVRADAVGLFDAQATSRHLDYAARRLRARDQGYYTIGSAGHEGNAAVAHALRPTDPAFLHYRSGAFFLTRARQVGVERPERDVLLGVVASREDPIAGGRHKVFGSAALHIPPQTSTIASHLPKAVGAALSIERAAKLRRGTGAGLGPRDAVVVASFGDASANHSTAVGAIHTARRCAYVGLPIPILFVCEDNGIGISVPTPPGWIASAYGLLEGLAFFGADGCTVDDAVGAARRAVEYVRSRRRPAFLHLSVVRLMGHAGSDIEHAYRGREDIERDELRDPLISTARHLVTRLGVSPEEVFDLYRAAAERVERAEEEVVKRPRLLDAADVMAPLAPLDVAGVAAEAARPPPSEARTHMFPDRLPETRGDLTLAEHINAALGDVLAKYPEALVFGEDVAAKGGVYGVTRGLARRASAGRVFDSVLDEQSILGLAIGAGHQGLLPIPEIQYLAYIHNAIDQLRGEAASLQFFSQRQFRNPMVVRIAGYAYQKGFGGHFHNDNSIASLRDIPGLLIATPSCGEDASAMLRTCVAAARVDGLVVVFVEPIALYHRRDLHEEGDGLLAAPYDPSAAAAIGSVRVYGTGSDLTILTFGNGVPMSRRVARRLADGLADGRRERVRVIDLRWLCPLPMDAVVREATATGRVLVVDETRRTGGVGEGIVSELIASGFRGPLARVSSRDSFVPLGPAADTVLLGEAEIEAAARALLPTRA
jgi:2-oxoisovalerate dehydrogenase E1 component